MQKNLINSHPLYKLEVWCLWVALIVWNFCINVYIHTYTEQFVHIQQTQQQSAKTKRFKNQNSP